MNEYCVSMLAVNNELYHHGILGMHWGIRRFQPYGQGYDPKREGKETGLAARLAGQTDSYSNLYGRGSNKARAKQYTKQLGSRAKSGVNEVLERLHYANDRLGKGIKDAGSNARRKLVAYASTEPAILRNGEKGTLDADRYRRLLKRNNTDLAKAVGDKTYASLLEKTGTFELSMRKKLSDIQGKGFERAFKDTLGSGTAQFKSAMEQTKVKSKLFAKNASATAALLAGALDPRSSASQIIEGRTPGGSKKVIGASRQDYDRFTGLNDPRLRPLDEYRDYRNMPTSVVGKQFKRQPTYREDAIKQLTNSSWSAPTTYDRRIPGSFMSLKELDRTRNKMLTTMDAPISELSAPLDLQLLSADRSHVHRDPYGSDQTAIMLNRIKLDEIQKRPSSTDIGKRLLGL